jgi:hypothetical protein
MSADRASYSNKTTKQRLQLPLNGTLFTTTRKVSPEKETPEVGGTMESELGSKYATSRIIAVDAAPDQHDTLVIQHVIIPNETIQLLSNWEETQVTIGGKQFPAVIRTVIMLASDYSSTTPAVNSAMPIGSDNRFQGAGYILYDRECVKTGLPLEPVFRVDRRTYVIPTTTTGQTFAPDGATIDETGEIVAEGTAATTGLNVAQSSVDPQGNGNALKVTTTPRRRKADGTTEVGWPKKQRKSKGVENLTPQKFLRQITTAVTTTQKELAADKVDDIPDPANPVSPQTQIVHEKENDHRYSEAITTEVIAEGAEPLAGEEYGGIVTLSTAETLVAEGTAADTGLDVVSSTVDPTGDGKAVKTTKRAKTPGWPDPVDTEVSKEGADQPPARYRKNLTRKKVSRKIAPGDIPEDPALTGNQVGRSFKKETPDRAEETITTETFTLNTAFVDEAIEQRPFVSIRSRMTPGTAPQLPVSGNGSSRLVYEGPTTNIYENTEEIATARPGPAGAEKEVRPFVAITTNLRYSTSNSIGTPTGSADVVFNDGSTIVYRVAEKSSTVRTGPAGVEKDVKPYGTFTTNKSYSANNVISTPTGSSNVVYNDGETLAYELGEITFSPTYREIGVEIEKQVGFTRTTRSRYSGSPTVATNLGSSSISFTDGVQTVYKVDEIELTPSGRSFDGGKTSNRLYVKSTITSYQSTSVGSGENYDSDVVATDGNAVIYRVNSTTITAKAPLVYETVVRSSIPSRLISIDLIPIARRDGKSEIAVFTNIEEGYTGQFPARVTEFYTEDPSAITGFAPLTMKPTAINYKGILFNLGISDTLHGAIVLQESIGNSDPDYEAQTLTRVIPATEPTEVPSGWQPFAIDVTPFEAGFLIKKVEVRYR